VKKGQSATAVLFASQIEEGNWPKLAADSMSNTTREGPKTDFILGRKSQCTCLNLKAESKADFLNAVLSTGSLRILSENVETKLDRDGG
jgi:hypothetical protein